MAQIAEACEIDVPTTREQSTFEPIFADAAILAGLLRVADAEGEFPSLRSKMRLMRSAVDRRRIRMHGFFQSYAHETVALISSGAAGLGVRI